MSGGAQLFAGRVIGGDFRIVGPLAEGGMGAVYVAEQLSTGKRRALKLMHLQIAHDAASVMRFTREAQVGSRIDSEHVVEVIAAGIDAETGLPWLAMELLAGDSLADHVAKRGPMSPAGVISIFRQLGHALTAAHAAGIIHRDLKPENIFVAVSRRVDVPFTIKILDFGIAKLIASVTSAQNSQFVGSPLWMAPEQLETTTTVGAPTDVWALGLIAFFMLTGRYYWLAANAGDASMHALLMEMAVTAMPPASERARALGADGLLSSGFDGWFARSCARDAKTRFPTVEDAVTALAAAFADGGSAIAGSPSATVQGRPPVALPSAGMVGPMRTDTVAAIGTGTVAAIGTGTVAAVSPLPTGTVAVAPTKFGAATHRTPQPISRSVARPSSSGRSPILAIGGAVVLLGLASAAGVVWYVDDHFDAVAREQDRTVAAAGAPMALNDVARSAQRTEATPAQPPAYESPPSPDPGSDGTGLGTAPERTTARTQGGAIAEPTTASVLVMTDSPDGILLVDGVNRGPISMDRARRIDVSPGAHTYRLVVGRVTQAQRRVTCEAGESCRAVLNLPQPATSPSP